jgi:putative membrane protein
MKTQSMRSLPLALALALSCGVALAQTTGSSAAPGTGSSATGGRAAPAAQPGAGARNAESRQDDKLARGDRKFIQEAAEGGMFEVQVAQLAASKATDPNVKSFASMLVDQHTAANNELVQLANAKKVELPAAPPRGMRRDIEKLGKLSGAEFDQRFVREVAIKDHEKDIKKFEKASGSVKDPQLKAWIDKTLPHLREHLAQAQKLPHAGGKADAAAMGNRAAPAGASGSGAPKPEVGTATPQGGATGANSGGKTGS